jgi:hypothetical protein
VTLYLATLTRNSRIFQGLNIVDLSKTVLDTYQFPIEFRLSGPFLGKRGYPKRDYQRQWWETCPLHPEIKLNLIIEGDEGTTDHGVPVARQGHQAMCGCHLISSLM